MNNDRILLIIDILTAALIIVFVVAAFAWAEKICRQRSSAAYLEGRYGVDHQTAMRFSAAFPQTDPREWKAMEDLGSFVVGIFHQH